MSETYAQTIQEITKTEVKEALSLMKNEKAPGPRNIYVELLKSAR